MADADALKLREKIKRKKPKFKRQEWFRQKMLGKKWRKPVGKQSKLRRHRKDRGKMPHPGYGSPKSVKFLNKAGFREIRIFNINDLEKINPSEEMALIGGTVGRKKRLEIMKKAGEKGIKIANIKY